MTAHRSAPPVFAALVVAVLTPSLGCDDDEDDGDSAPAGPERTCNYATPSPGLCIEWPASLSNGSAQSLCESGGSLAGTYSDTETCDDLNGTDGLVGRCLMTPPAGESSDVYYYGDDNDCPTYAAECAGDDGAWTAGPVCQGGSGGESGSGGGAGAGGQGGSG